MRSKTWHCRKMIIIALILLEALLIIVLLGQEKPITETDWLTAYSTESDAFRAMKLGDNGFEEALALSVEWDTDVYSILAAQLVLGEVEKNEKKDGSEKAGDSEATEYPGHLDYRRYQWLAEQMETEKPVEWKKLINGFQTILADIRYFPVAADSNLGLSGISYENGWGDARTYGGDRLHEGTDIMDNANIRGSYPIVSISDGIIEHIGWLEQGGYRIGIRSPRGTYFYYAHLASYAENFLIGQSVTAGQLIGFMGDTGYSAVEGTVGNFPVHLHLGIYLETDHYEELSVNPYYILKYLENYTVSYAKESYLWYTVN